MGLPARSLSPRPTAAGSDAVTHARFSHNRGLTDRRWIFSNRPAAATPATARSTTRLQRNSGYDRREGQDRAGAPGGGYGGVAWSPGSAVYFAIAGGRQQQSSWRSPAGRWSRSPSINTLLVPGDVHWVSGDASPDGRRWPCSIQAATAKPHNPRRCGSCSTCWRQVRTVHHKWRADEGERLVRRGRRATDPDASPPTPSRCRSSGRPTADEARRLDLGPDARGLDGTGLTCCREEQNQAGISSYGVRCQV